MSGAGLCAEVQPRGGFGELSGRLMQAPCTVAYLGASVTAQRDGYRPRLHELLCAETGQRHASINAGTGGVGSVSGVFLMDRLVLDHSPQLCFVEYLTSDLDGRATAATIAPALEGIVSKLRRHGCAPCLLDLYRRDRDFAAPSEVVAAYEAIASHHDVPSIAVGGTIYDLVSRGELRVDDVLRDVVHTTAAGSRLVADSVARGVLEIAAGPAPSLPARERLWAEDFSRAHVVAARPEWLSDPEGVERRRFRFAYEYLRITSANWFDCSFAGELVGMVVILGPSSGFVRISSAREVQEVQMWDEYCHYERLSTVIFPRRYPPGRVVRIQPSEAEIDHSARRPPGPRENGTKDLRVIGFMVRP